MRGTALACPLVRCCGTPPLAMGAATASIQVNPARVLGVLWRSRFVPSIAGDVGRYSWQRPRPRDHGKIAYELFTAGPAVDRGDCVVGSPANDAGPCS
jgi:hypothetical protein